MSPLPMPSNVLCGAKGIVCGDDVFAKQAENVIVDLGGKAVPSHCRVNRGFDEQCVSCC